MKKYIILVAGYEYSRGVTNFATIAEKRRKYLLWQNPVWENDTDVVFVRFDVKNATIERNISEGTSRSWRVESKGFDV